jgi:glycosyltransferase involved in cell wall biosynthesis
MKTAILYLVPDLLGPPGGIARYCRLTTQALQESGANVRVIALMDEASYAEESRPNDAPSPIDRAAYTPCAGQRVAFIRQAVRQALQARPALILVGHVNFATLGWALAGATGARQATFVYGIDAWTLLSRSRRLGLQRSDRIFAISHYTARQATEANRLDPARLRVLHNCLDPQILLTSPQPPEKSAPSLLTVARMSLAEQYKGHDVVIRAMPELLRRFPDLRYDIVGDGDARPGLEALAEHLGVAAAVRFHGIVSEAALRQHYAQASLFIMPSRAEGFGFVFLEAMAHGLPVIGGNADATPEVIVHGETGLLVTPTSVDAVVEAASRLLGDDALRKTMGEAARQRAAAQFSYSEFRRKLVEELSQIAPAIFPAQS